MAKARNAQPTAPAADKQGFGISDIVGTFAYRFSGYAVVQGQSFWLTGIGRFDIQADGSLTGAHQSASLALKGADAKVSNSAYDLRGTITMTSDGTGESDILFTKTTGTGLNVRGEFKVMLGGDKDHLWFISTRAVVPGIAIGTDDPAHESVTLEAVRLIMP